jgi:hypothetical protein
MHRSQRSPGGYSAQFSSRCIYIRDITLQIGQTQEVTIVFYEYCDPGGVFGSRTRRSSILLHRKISGLYDEAAVVKITLYDIHWGVKSQM